MKYFLILPFILFTACDSNNDNSGTGNEKLSCPASALVPYHEVLIQTDEDLPKKIAIEVDDELKYDECLEQAVIPPPPIVHGARSKSGLAVVVQHYGAYEQLPKTVSFRVYDRKDCINTDLYFQAFNIPLEFKKEYPNGPQCGSNTLAKTSVLK